MKKTLFTICSVLTVCAVIFMSCEKKDDPNMKKVYYNTQPGYSTGNPYGSGGSTTGGSATTTGSGTSSTSTTTGAAACTATLNGATAAAQASGNTIVISTSGGASYVMLIFQGTTAPVSGTYQVVTGSPVGAQCTFSDNNGVNAASGTVTVTTGSPNKVTFSGVVCGSTSYSGTGCY
jgi:hypothetical protein